MRLRLKQFIRFLLIVFLIWMVVLIGLSLRVYTFGNQDNAQPSDVIIVLGSGLRRDGSAGDALIRRAIWSARLYEEGIAPAIICTGGIGRRQTRSEASACRELLIARGVPDSAIYMEGQSASTEENAIYAQAIMETNGWQTAVIVTDSFHILRANWIFDGQGVEHVTSPVPRNWMRTFWYLRFFTREIIALHWQAFQDILGLSVTRVDL